MKRYNTPHRHRVIKTRLTEEEYAEFSERVTLCKMSQAEFTMKPTLDEHNHSGNIHVHIVINSLRIAEVPLLPYMCRTDFADIQNKKECGGTDNGKDDF